MVNKFVLFIFFFFIPIGIYSQRKEISQAKEWVKAGNELAKAEESMRNLLKDSANRKNEKIWLVLFDAIKKQYAQQEDLSKRTSARGPQQEELSKRNSARGTQQEELSKRNSAL